MPLSRYDHDRLREIEARLTAEEPALAERLARIGTDPWEPETEPVSRWPLVLVCTAIALASVLLVLATSLGARPADHARTAPAPPASATPAPDHPALPEPKSVRTVPPLGKPVPRETGEPGAGAEEVS
ncbi:DUF3040 domain-containing protein [Marinitenerispora sediminis]|uniref:DUF3040 domain-containing protein n=1 Tax=Marinitenerispora sediminis TaxID=1931232 RepID=UPI0013143F59|nr:DUF3040 domain-containing protein [Marinitenerispora sediminis]